MEDKLGLFAYAFSSFLLLGVSSAILEAAPGQHIGEEIVLKSDEPGLSLNLTTPNDISGWTFIPGSINKKICTLHIKADKDWQLEARATESATSGYMTEWNGYEYTSRKLAHPMNISAASRVSLPMGGVIQTGTKTCGRDIVVVLEQTVTKDDECLSDGHVYHMKITFTLLPKV